MSESSLDSELLAVARGRGAKKRSRKELSESEEEELSSEDVSLDDESDLEEMRATSKKKRGGSAAKPAKKRPARRKGSPDSDSEEAPPPPPAEESSDEDRLEIDEEDLIVDEADRKRLAQMTELQREFELATRAEKRNQEMLRQKLLAKQQQTEEKAERAGAQAAKRTHGKSGREERAEAAKKTAMEELKAARERKARGVEERARKRDESESLESEGEEEEGDYERGERRRRAERDEPSEEGALSEDDLSNDDRLRGDLYGRRGEEDEDDEEAPFEDVKKIQVRRLKLEEWLNEPFFEDTMPGCIVRLAAQEAPGPTGLPEKRYMMAQVVAVEPRPPGVYKDSGERWASPYRFGPEERREKTHKWLLVERGGSQRWMPMAKVSNAGITEGEFDSFQRALKGGNRRQISRRHVADTHERLMKANTYTYTAEDVERVVREKKAKGIAPRNLALEKARIEAQLQHAQEVGDTETAAQLEAQIAQMEAAITAQGGRRGASMAELNKRNAELNFKNALDNVSNRVGATGTQEAQTSQLDPFSRRATRPQVYWSTKRHQQSEDGDGGQASQDPAAANGAHDGEGEAAAQQQVQQQAKGRPDLDAAVDLSRLDLSVLDRPARMPPMARKLLGQTWRPAPAPPGARIISFDEYKRSRGWS